MSDLSTVRPEVSNAESYAMRMRELALPSIQWTGSDAEVLEQVLDAITAEKRKTVDFGGAFSMWHMAHLVWQRIAADEFPPRGRFIKVPVQLSQAVRTELTSRSFHWVTTTHNRADYTTTIYWD